MSWLIVGTVELRPRLADERLKHAAPLRSPLSGAEQHGLGRGRLTALSENTSVDLFIMEAIHDLAGEQLGIAGRIDAHLTQHLTRDQLDVFVVNRHALTAVHALDFVDEVLLHRLT